MAVPSMCTNDSALATSRPRRTSTFCWHGSRGMPLAGQGRSTRNTAISMRQDQQQVALT